MRWDVSGRAMSSGQRSRRRKKGVLPGKAPGGQRAMSWVRREVSGGLLVDAK